MALEPLKVTEHPAIATPIEGRDLGFRTPGGVSEEVYSSLDLWTQRLLQWIVNQQSHMNRRWVTSPTTAIYYGSFDGMNIQPVLPATASIASFGPSATHPTCSELTTGTIAGHQWLSYVSTDSSRWSRPGVVSGMFSIEDVSNIRFRFGVSNTQLYNFALLPAAPMPGSWISTTSLFFEVDTDRSANLLIKWQNDFSASGGFNSFDTGLQLSANEVYLFEFELLPNGLVEARLNRETIMPEQSVSLSDTRNLFPGATLTSLGGGLPSRRLRTIQGSWNINYQL